MIDGVGQDACLDFAVQFTDDPLSCQPDLVEHVRVSDIMLSAPFNFYNFQVRLNIEECNDIQNQNYIRFYKLKIEQLLKDQEMLKGELELSRSMIDEFRKGQEKAERQIKKLEIQNVMYLEEKTVVVRSAQKRIMHIVNSFQEQFKELDKTYNKYKDFINNEFEVWESIKLGLEKVIQKKEDEIEQLKDALSLPRKHYKFIDNLTSDKIIE